MSLLTEQEISQEASTVCGINHGVLTFTERRLCIFARAIEAAVIAKIKTHGPSAFEYLGEPWFDGNHWHEQMEVTRDRKVAEFKAYLGKSPTPLYKLPSEGD